MHNILQIRHTERSEVSQSILVRFNPSPQSSPLGEEEKIKRNELIPLFPFSFSLKLFYLLQRRKKVVLNYISINFC